jgi:Cysteine rich repeat
MKNVTQNSIRRSIYLALVFAIAGISQAGAQSGPSPQEQMACRSDAGKFCAEHVGKPPQMNACLRENKAKLSEPCRKVVESHGG